MNKLFPSSNIYLSKSKISKAGRGVFAVKNIKKGEIIEVCPAVEFPEEDYKNLKKTKLRDYYFIWNQENTKVAIALGYGSLYNHSYDPNATYKKSFKRNIVSFIAIKNIKKDEEITVNYNYGNPKDKSSIWIKSIKPS